MAYEKWWTPIVLHKEKKHVSFKTNQVNKVKISHFWTDIDHAFFVILFLCILKSSVIISFYSKYMHINTDWPAFFYSSSHVEGEKNHSATYSFQRNTNNDHMHWLSLIHMNFLKYIKYIYWTVLKMHLVSHFETSVWLLFCFFLYLVCVSGCFFIVFFKFFSHQWSLL